MGLVARRTPRRHRRPILTLPYLLQVIVSYVLAMFIPASALRRAVFKAYFLAIAATFAAWIDVLPGVALALTAGLVFGVHRRGVAS